MKKVSSLIVFLFMICTGVSAQIALGVGATYVADGVFGIQGKSLIGISEKMDVSPSATLWFEQGVDFSIDADFHYHLFSIGEGFLIHPFAGINYTSASTDGRDGVAINVGLSLQVATENGAIYLEPKYVLDNFNSLAFTAGYYF